MAALKQPASAENEAHRKILGLLPQGIYEDYKGDRYFVLGIERGFTRNGHERYFVLMLPLREDPEEHVIRRLLVGTESGERDGWFFPARKDLKPVPRFKRVKKITLIGLTRSA
jgi:hypothetical protein